MSTASSALSAMVLGCMPVCFVFVLGCASTRAGIEPPGATVTPPPVVGPTPSPPLGPPPGYVKPENYWVREKIILTSEPEPPGSAPPKRPGKKEKHTKKTG